MARSPRPAIRGRVACSSKGRGPSACLPGSRQLCSSAPRACPKKSALSPGRHRRGCAHAIGVWTPPDGHLRVGHRRNRPGQRQSDGLTSIQKSEGKGGSAKSKTCCALPGVVAGQGNPRCDSASPKTATRANVRQRKARDEPRSAVANPRIRVRSTVGSMPPRPAMRSRNILVAVERANSHAHPLENGHENH